MLGGGFLSSRLATRLRQKEGLSYGVGSSYWSRAWEPDDWFQANAIHAPQNGGKLRAAFLDELQRALDDGFTTEELSEAKSGWLQGRKVSRANDAELARTLAGREYVSRTLAWDASFEKAVAALTLEQVNGALKRWIDPARLITVQAGDFEGAKKRAPDGKDEPMPAASVPSGYMATGR